MYVQSDGRPDSATGRPEPGASNPPLAASTAGPAISTTKKDGIDITSPIFIGGGFDGYTPFTDIVGPYVKYRKGGGNYFNHYQEDEIQTAINLMNDAFKPIIIVGHSWGGSNALWAAQKAKERNILVDLIVTIDPVGSPDEADWENESFQPIAAIWISVVASKPGEDNGGDFVAGAWGKTPVSVQKNANILLFDKSADHADFWLMMETAKAESCIQLVQSMPRVEVHP